MTVLLHFISIFVSFALLTLALAVVHVMIGTYRDRIIAALRGGDLEPKATLASSPMRRRSLMLSLA
jgi:hypothetical protein